MTSQQKQDYLYNLYANYINNLNIYFINNNDVKKHICINSNDNSLCSYIKVDKEKEKVDFSGVDQYDEEDVFEDDESESDNSKKNALLRQSTSNFLFLKKDEEDSLS